MDGTVQTFPCTIAEADETTIIVYYRMVRDHNLHGIHLNAGELTVGYFWCDRPYNLYHWVRSDGSTAAYYFNVGAVTRWDGATLAWNDYAVDVLATPDGRLDVLDEDEIPDDCDQNLRDEISRGRDVILRDLPTLIASATATTARLLAP